MVQIDISMPKSCGECPLFQGGIAYGCILVPGVQKWQAEIMKEYAEKRSEHCPLKEVKA